VDVPDEVPVVSTVTVAVPPLVSMVAGTLAVSDGAVYFEANAIPFQ